jgi:hypothetical protein
MASRRARRDGANIPSGWTAAIGNRRSVLVGELALVLADGIPDVDHCIGRSRAWAECELADDREQIVLAR